MLPPALHPAMDSPQMNPFSSPTMLQRTPTNTSAPGDLIACAPTNSSSAASSPHRALHHGGPSTQSLHTHHSPRLRHTGGGGVSRPRANTDWNIRSRYHHHSQHPYNGRRTSGMFIYDNSSNEAANSYQPPAISYSNPNNNHSWLGGSVSPAVMPSHPSSPNFNADISIEDRKPTIINGSPHSQLPTLLPGPPASPSLSSRSRDSPGSLPYPLSSGEYSERSFQTVPSSASDISLASDPATAGYSTYVNHSYFNGPSQMDVTVYNGPKSPEDYENQIAILRNQLREMDFLRRQDQAKLAELQTGQEIEQQMTRDVDAQFKASWKGRTEARTKTLCALNRAGNALCAWHDSRRERRQYPPRMAPAGVLNCGCTYEQALFEESLTRQGVGAYQPGESVRMDPALRNPLLSLLQKRYGYRDGDFERLRVETTEGEETWIWPENDDSKAWSTGKAQIGNTTSSRRVGH